MKQKKTFVIFLAKNYLSNHPKKGQFTHFLQAVKDGKKKHTIRGNYDYWENIVKQVNASEAIISVRQWSGRPYHSSPVEVFQLHEAEIERVHFERPTKQQPRKVAFIKIGDVKKTGADFDKVARNDGFNYVDDFMAWFPPVFDGGIIHFKKIVWPS